MAGSQNGYFSFFNRLSQALKSVAVKFRKFIQEKNSSVRQSDFSWSRRVAAANEGGFRGGVVRVSKWPIHHNWLFFWQKPRHAVNSGYFQRFFKRQRWQKSWQGFCQKGF